MTTKGSTQLSETTGRDERLERRENSNIQRIYQLVRLVAHLTLCVRSEPLIDTVLLHETDENI